MAKISKKVIGVIVVAVCINQISFIDGFTARSLQGRLSALHRLEAKPQNADDLFASEGWASIEKDLNGVPIFTCANKQGQPLAYSVEVNDEAYQLPFFYCDIEDAKTELEKARADTNVDGLDLIPYPLGKAFQMWANDKAVVVPSKSAIMAAGAPPNANPIGQQVPLFACMDIMQEMEDGTAVLPLFLDLDEANAAMDQALEVDGGSSDDFEVVSLSLPRAVELLATVPETPAFQFMPPMASVKYIQEYLS